MGMTQGQRRKYGVPECAGSQCVMVAMPYVFRYLANELVAMNIKMKLDVN